MKTQIIIGILLLTVISGCSQDRAYEPENPFYRTLTPEEMRVIVNKGTERAFTGKYDKFYEEGIYVCKRCGTELYRSTDKFNSGCGWPSFDDEVPGAVNRVPDGFRKEITCANCDAHLGHVFMNEGFTDRNTRHCVNSISLEFMPASGPKSSTSDTAYFAGGCFWGVEYYLEQAPGIRSVASGYMGGSLANPSYRQVSSHRSGHAETVQVIFDPSLTDYEKLVSILEQTGLMVATKITPATNFWKAEDYHQDYYSTKGGTPYCHTRVDRFPM